jgi:hypothetical protein
MDSIAAKEFLISRVVQQAQDEGNSLTEIERKMLYFTEVGPSLPDIYEVNAEFERDYDNDEYEAKITGLLKRARDTDRTQTPLQGRQWDDSISTLKKEDHYILVMVYSAFPEYRKTLLPTHRVRDYVIYIAIGIGVVLAAIGFAEWSHR